MVPNRKKYDIFISYRRKGGSERAELVKAVLEKNGYRANRIFMDTHSLRSGDFREKIKEAISESVDIIVLINNGCFDDIKDEDYFVFELSEAVRLQKNIVLCFFDEVSSIDVSKLPDTLKSIPYHNAVKYNNEYPNAFYEKMCSFLSKRKKRTFGVPFFICLFLAVAGLIICHNKCLYLSPLKAIDVDSNIVDLGLPSGTLWSTCNLGAKTISEFGSLYMWGSVNAVEAKHKNDIDYYVSHLNIIGTSYDAASLSLGKHWRLPSEEQVVELVTKCNWLWSNIDGRNGYVVTGPNGKTLFLPVAGCVLLDGYENANQFGYYWIGERHPSNAKYAKELVIGLNQINVECGRQYVGRSIRPVFISDKAVTR